MIKYRINDYGEAIEFSYQKDSIPLENGWQSIQGDKIPEDINQYHTQEYRDYLAQQETNTAARQFLSDTDWKVIRHIRRKALGLETEMTEEEYLALETERQEKADSIIED